MEDPKLLDLLRKKSPQTTLEVAKSVGMSWHIVHEHLLEMQISGKIDRINVGRQNLWFIKGQKWKGISSSSIFVLIGLAAIIIAAAAVIVSLSGMPSAGNSTAIQPLNYVIYNDTNDPRYRTSEEVQETWISFDKASNTITLRNDGNACTQTNPCTFSDIYKASSDNNWDSIDRIDNNFTIKSKIIIDGYLVSQIEQIYITKPLVIGKNGSARFGIFDGKPHSGIFLETNVSESDEINGAAFINHGSVEFFDSNYKIYSATENGIHQSPGAVFRANRFDMQRNEPGITMLFLPINYILDDYVERDNIIIKCAGNCTEVIR